ncbi:uncharacterized protein LMH87_007581 [Akanthomyces muscarius]|uniref:Uncharacterized protein n=1 Tax=Akanthomyces muscarius TaxID=2231603 RepID=A0A9W8QMF8_AKAMU|nr:uncharacterized protein LMH87_007581 [Akanthomyces muscarius]KAJ4161548.1 hypothetical protein LMH87_007581 [Akanthomyces muscarius]
MVALNEEAAKDPAALGREVTTFLQEMQGAGVMENVEKFAQTIEASYVPRSKPGKRKLIETAMWHNDERRTTMPLAGEATAHDGMSSATLPAVNTMTMPAIGRQTKASGPFGAFLGLSPSKASLLFPAEMLAKIEVLEQRTGADDPLLDIATICQRPCAEFDRSRIPRRGLACRKNSKGLMHSGQVPVPLSPYPQAHTRQIIS